MKIGSGHGLLVVMMILYCLHWNSSGKLLFCMSILKFIYCLCISYYIIFQNYVLFKYTVLQFYSFYIFSLNLSSDQQLFYLGYALPWCAVHTEALMRNHVIKDEHAPDRFRVIGPLSNSEKFAEAWSCPNSGLSKMNPKDKCKVW